MEKIKVELTEDFKDEFGHDFKAGQTGSVALRLWERERPFEYAAVDFHGYEQERAEVDAWLESFPSGSPAYVVPWAAFVPMKILKRVAE